MVSLKVEDTFSTHSSASLMDLRFSSSLYLFAALDVYFVFASLLASAAVPPFDWKNLVADSLPPIFIVRSCAHCHRSRFVDLTKETWTPKFRWFEEQSRHRYTPNGTEDHVGFFWPQSKHILLAGLVFNFSKILCDCALVALILTEMTILMV